MDPVSQDILGDTWRTLESREDSVPAVEAPGTGVEDVESLDSPPKVVVDPSTMGTDSTPMCIDSEDPAEEVLPIDLPVPPSPSPSPTYSWTPLLERHCGPLHEDSHETNLKRPRSPSFVQENERKRILFGHPL